MPLPKNIAVVGLLLAVCSAGFGQTKNFFDEFDFSKGNWRLFGIFNWEHPAHKEDLWKLQDTLGNFYVNDLVVLQQVKDGLTPLKEGALGYAYQYELKLYKDDTLKKSLSINLESSFAEIGRVRYKIDPNMMMNLVGKVKKMPKTKYTFATLEEARKGYSMLSKIDSILLNPAYDCGGCERWEWQKYEGQMTIVVYDSTKKDFTYSTGEKIIRDKIKKKFPNEKFMVKDAGGSFDPKKPYNEYDYHIYCNEKLGASYNEYRAYKKWAKYKDIPIIVYGLTEQQIKKILTKK